MTPIKFMPFSMMATVNTPRMVPSSLPLPPASEVPPRAQAATIFRVKGSPMVGALERRLAARKMPARAASTPLMANTRIFVLSTPIPATRAVRSLPPMAKMVRPLGV